MKRGDRLGGTEQADDLSRRLTLFGALAVAAGAAFIAFGLFQPILPAMMRRIPDGPAFDWRSVWMGLALYVSVGAVLVWAGVGSLRRRPWVRPIMLLLAGTWLLVGTFCLLLAVWILDDLALLGGNDSIDPSSPLVWIVRLVVVGIVLGGGIVLPALLLWAYRDPRVQTTCERHRGSPSWSDGCPPAVLGLSAALLAGGVLSLPMLARPAVPLCGRLLTGGAGAAALLLGVGLCAALAWATFRLRYAGWLATMVFLVFLGASTAWTFAVVEPARVYEALGYPQEEIALLAGAEPLLASLAVWGSLGLTAAGVVYLARLRHHFDRTGGRGQT